MYDREAVSVWVGWVGGRGEEDGKEEKGEGIGGVMYTLRYTRWKNLLLPKVEPQYNEHLWDKSQNAISVL